MEAELPQQIKELIVEILRLRIDPSEIPTEEPLFGKGLGLDSIDALELAVGIEKTFGVKIEDSPEGRQALATVRTMSDFIEQHREQAGTSE